jgi:KDO2-lipid IV(A) lauroyltransferase
MRKTLIQWRDYMLLRLVFLIARPLPFRALQRVGAALGLFCWHVIPFRRRVVLANLSACFGDTLDAAAIQRLARDFYVQLGTTLLEFCGYWRLKPEQIQELVTVEGAEHVETVRGFDKGALLVSGHFGNWELLGAWLAASGFDVSFMIKTQSNLRVDRLQNDVRARAGVGVIRTGASVRDMVRVLRGGGLIGLLSDQDAGAAGVIMDFVGQPASVFTGTATLVHKLKLPMVTGFMVRQRDGTHKLVVQEPVIPDPDWDEATALAEITRIHVQRLEAMVRKHPDHYFWVHRRWKSGRRDGAGARKEADA